MGCPLSSVVKGCEQPDWPNLPKYLWRFGLFWIKLKLLWLLWAIFGKNRAVLYAYICSRRISKPKPPILVKITYLYFAAGGVSSVWPDGLIFCSIFAPIKKQNFVQCQIILPKWVQNFTKYQSKLSQHCIKDCQKWRYLAKSGHTACRGQNEFHRKRRQSEEIVLFLFLVNALFGGNIIHCLKLDPPLFLPYRTCLQVRS